jgi:hypothetical protein
MPDFAQPEQLTAALVFAASDSRLVKDSALGHAHKPHDAALSGDYFEFTLTILMNNL